MSIFMSFCNRNCAKLSDMAERRDLIKWFLGIPFSAMDFGEGAQKDIIVNFQEKLSVKNMYGWHG